MKHLYLFLIMGILCCLQAVAQPISVTTLNIPYAQDFNSLSNSTASSALPAGWFLVETGTGAAANGLYSVGTGSSNAGDAYSFGVAGSTDRALGSLRSGSVLPVIGAGFTNSSGANITTLQISYRGEQWRLGAVRANDRMDFQISYDATSLSTGTWIHVDELDFVAPVNSGATGALDGNTNGSTVSFDITGLAITHGQTFFIRWNDFDVASSDDGLAIDNFSLTPVGVTTEPSISFSPTAISFGDVNAGTQKTISYEVVASNLLEDITLLSDNSLFELSTDNVLFSSSVQIPASGGIVFVRFSPLANGAVSAAITHTAATYAKDISVSGFGFVQAENIITIAEARTRSAGVKLTVAGRVTVANEHGNPSFVQDATGGIPVFDATLANSVSIGDSVIVTGPIGLFNDQKQISGSGIFFTKVDVAPNPVEPKIIALSDLAAHEGMLVKIQGVELVNKSFVFYPQSTERISDGVSSADLRIDGDTDIPGLAKPQTAFDVTGVVGRFRANAQLLPRFQADIPAAVEPSSPTDSISRDLTFDVVNWNFEFFGARAEDYGNEEYGPADEALQLQNIKQVLGSLNADIVAVEEVSDEAYFASLVSQLGKYDYQCSQRFSYSFNGPSDEFPPQKLCIIYDTTTVKIESARPMFESLYDEARTTNPALLPGYPTGDPASFYSSGRLPFLVNASATIKGVTEKISFVILHSKSGATVADFDRRAYDAAVLKDSLDVHFANAKIIVLGDLNDDLDQSIVTGYPTSYANFLNDTSYNAITKSLSESGARSTVSFQDVIDHQIISTELNEEFLEGSASIIAPFRVIDNYATTTSDHLPVLSRYKFVAPVIGFVTADQTVAEQSGGFEITVQLSKALNQDKSIQISANGEAQRGQDFQLSTAPENPFALVIPAGQTSASFTFTPLDDTADELVETIIFSLIAEEGVAIGNGEVAVSLEDNDVPSISFEKLYTLVSEGNSGVVKLVLSTAVVTDQVVTIGVTDDWRTSYNVDYTTLPAPAGEEFEIPVAAGATEISFEFNALADKKKEFLEVVGFRIVALTPGLETGQKFASAVGIENVSKKPIFAVYPNPTRDFIQLVAENFDEDDVLQIELREPNGKIVVAKQSTLSDLNDDIRESLLNKRKGLYTMKIVADDESVLIRILKI